MPVSDHLSMFMVYQHSIEYPCEIVVREFRIQQGQVLRGPIVLRARGLQEIRMQMEMRGLFPIPRSPGDDPCIVETWL